MIYRMSAREKAADLVTEKEFFSTFQAPLQDWQIAGLAILVCKGGLYWGDGSFDKEGRANLARYKSAAQAANCRSLVAYIENIELALAGSPELQNQFSTIQVAMKAFMASMTRTSPWTYCGVLEPDTLTAMVQPD